MGMFNYMCLILCIYNNMIHLYFSYNQDATTAGFSPPPAMSMYSFKRVTTEPVKPEDLQRVCLFYFHINSSHNFYLIIYKI